MTTVNLMQDSNAMIKLFASLQKGLSKIGTNDLLYLTIKPMWIDDKLYYRIKYRIFIPISSVIEYITYSNFSSFESIDWTYSSNGDCTINLLFYPGE